MRLNKMMQRKISRGLHVFGDCDNCGHSVVYHFPLVGCAKCSCGEFH